MTDRLFQLEQEINYSRQQAYEDFADAYALESLSSEALSSEALSSEALSSEALSSEALSSEALSLESWSSELTNPAMPPQRQSNSPGQRVGPPNKPLPIPPQVNRQQLPDVVQIYMTVKGARSGDIQGPVTLNARQGSIQILGFSHEISSPRDPASGLPTGKHLHLPLIVAKPLDQSTPLLYNILATNENLPTVTLKFWSNSSGMDKNIFTIILTNANIARIQSQSPNQQSAMPINNTHYELISFTYQKIEWTWVDSGSTSTDEWNSSDR
jgi:type VI secretion system secreted protein Hcp